MSISCSARGSDLARDYNIKLPADTNRVVDEAVVKLLKNQRSDGGFGYWPDSEKSDLWVSAYALWGLSLAKERGRPVPAQNIASATRYLRDQIAMCTPSGITERANSPGAAPSPKGRPGYAYEARIRYAKKELPETPLDRGFYVRKLVRSVRPDALPDALRTIPQSSATTANASDLVLVDLLVVTPDPREKVVIDDPLPAGLEPVQSKLAITARDLAVTEPGDDGDRGDADDACDDDERAMGRTYQRSWYHREFHDDRVLTFVEHMASGMYHYRYLARATTTGRFIVPPTRAECMYEPETFGRTGAVTFEVKGKCPVSSFGDALRDTRRAASRAVASSPRAAPSAGSCSPR